MAQGSQQFTAAKVLEAAQQAEAGGNRDYAIQFYRHIAEQHPQSTEAVSAREGLTRLLGYQTPGIQQSEHTQPPPAQSPTTQPPTSGQSAQSQRAGGEVGDGVNGSRPHGGAAQVNGVDYTNGSAADATPHYATGVAATQMPNPAANPIVNRSTSYPAPVPVQRVEAEQHPPIPTQFLLPSTQDHYRMGRFIALVFGILGWLMLVLGVVAAFAGTGIVPGTRGLITLVPGLIYGVGGLVTGLVMIFSSQLARAIFDNANASRDLVAIERARARQQAGHS